MSDIKVAKRYAKGLYLFADETNANKEVYKEMNDLQNLIEESRDLQNFLKSPVLDYKTKQRIAKSIFASYSVPVQKFIHLIIQRRREASLGRIAGEYITYSDIENHIKKAVLTSAVALDQATIDKIVKESNLLAKEDTLELENKVDPSIIGGYIFKVGDQQIDASVKSKFTKLKQEFDVNYYEPKIPI